LERDLIADQIEQIAELFVWVSTGPLVQLGLDM
jgi:hypothetical protein